MRSTLLNIPFDPFVALHAIQRAGQPWPILFDSSLVGSPHSHFSILAFAPVATVEGFSEHTRVTEGASVKHSDSCPLQMLAEVFQSYRDLHAANQDPSSEWPFTGGAAGSLSYDFNRRLEDLPALAPDDLKQPLLVFGIYDFALLFDHRQQIVRLVSHEIAASLEERAAVIESSIQDFTPRPAPNIEPIETTTIWDDLPHGVSSNFSRADFLQAVDRVRAYIQAGDVYQINLTQRFQCKTRLAPIELYQRLRTVNPAPFSCFFDYGDAQLLSSSPERFLHLHGSRIETRPIKGTRPRTGDLQEDIAARCDLATSEKDRAELLMIVDLERNDIGRICVPNSVRVSDLFAIESYATVFHSVANISGELRPGYTIFDAIRATFPGGSITGAPKIRAMEIIEELEPCRRGAYTGSIGYIDFSGNADFNIAIRTLFQRGEDLYFHAGGGVVWDSDPASEYTETLTKARALFQTVLSPHESTAQEV